jgi:hypothetical protein
MKQELISNNLIDRISELLKNARNKVVHAINQMMVLIVKINRKFV